MVALAERERHSLASNLIGWCGCLAAALALPNTEAFIFPLVLRLLAMMSTRVMSVRLRRTLAQGGPFERHLVFLGASLALAGVSWALLVLPAFALVSIEAFAFVIIGITIVGVSLICAMLGPLPKIMAAFMASFIGSVLAGLALRYGQPDPGIYVATLAMTSGMVAYSLGIARQSHQVAEALVENRRLGEELADALAHAEFLSRRDPLTGLLNRRALFGEGTADTGLATVDGALLAIDLDHFKRINDRFGHATGDRVLAATGDALRDVLRTVPGGDHRAVRLGGEEFALVVADTTFARALGVAETLRLAIAEIGEILQKPDLVVSASIGVASMAAGERLAQIHARADEALYRAKEKGRNRVEAAA